MRLVYVDESYCKVCYYVAALLVPKTEVRSLSSALDEVVARAVRNFPGIDPTAELHGYDMFHGGRDWASLKKMPRARIGAYDQALRAIAEHNVAIIIRGVMSQRLKERYRDRAWHPHAITLWHLIERCDEHLEVIGDLGLIIADEPARPTSNRSTEPISGSSRAWVRGGTDPGSSPTLLTPSTSHRRLQVG